MVEEVLLQIQLLIFVLFVLLLSKRNALKQMDLAVAYYDALAQGGGLAHT